jgi:hypothetical protein|tara:strand:- start:15 stop:461 length:447 start_codon:yes stop_codon:yes gene_type:complete
MRNMKGNNMIDTNRRVYVYFNLHKKVWSVRQDGKIVEHTKYIMLKDARYLVGQAGRKKVLEEKRKNVHAGVSGYVVDRVPNVPDFCTTVHYNPYKNETFISHATERPMVWSPHVVMDCRHGRTNVEAIFDNHKDVLKSSKNIKVLTCN